MPNTEPLEVSEVDLILEFYPSVNESINQYEQSPELNNIEASNLPKDSNVRSSTQQFIEQKEQQAQVQREENAKNWQWFQMSKLEDRQGAYSGSVSIDAIQELAVSKAPVPENLRQERDESVARASQFVFQVASKALEQDGKELVPGVKIAAVQGYTITRNEATGDLSIDKSNQTFLRHDTGKIEQSYRQ
jgi:hypothetical protein